MTDYDTLEVFRRGPVGWLVFDRPEVGNAINATMFEELPVAWQELDDDDSVRVIVNAANGPSFQTGLDVRQLANSPGALRESARQTKRAELRLTAWHNGIWKPVIAAVNGPCVGGGLHFVADADIVLASAEAEFSDPHVSVGQVSAFESIGLARKSPMEPVVRMALTGAHETMPAERARHLGILSEVTAPDELWDRTQALAETIARHDPAELAKKKQAMWHALEVSLSNARHPPVR